MQKSQNSKNEDLEKKRVTELANVAELGNAAPVTIVHNVQLQNQDQQVNANVNANTEAYDSFESDDDDDNIDPIYAPEHGIHPDINTYDQNQEPQGGYPQGTNYQGQEDQNIGLQQEYVDEDGDVKYDLVTESSHDVSESDYIKQDL